MFVYAVIYGVNYEGSNLVGIFSDYVKARDFELEFERKHNVGAIKDYDWCEIRKVELDKVYGGFAMFDIGEEL
jgi:uncharacterized protein YjbK